MNKLTNALILAALAAGLLASKAQANGGVIHIDKLQAGPSGLRAAPQYIAPIHKEPRPLNCNKSAPWNVELEYYLDGDTPTDIAYQDYLEDVQWWYAEYDICEGAFIPEILE